ncbi:SEL1-like repeat protein, partial [Endozoicomonas sp. ONNA2]|uniref:SEL1-like repeat protein n=1 Tax=Endozoicomonas sp. ONNA2 TaxID=2828741 RepID=UPI002147A232
MERLNYNQRVDSFLNAHGDSTNTIDEAYFFAGRKVRIDPDVVRSMCLADQHWSFSRQAKTVLDVAINSNFSPALSDKSGIQQFNKWFWGSTCPFESLQPPPHFCTCRRVHQYFPKQKVGGILTENERRVVVCGSPDAPGNLNPEALLALGACRLIESERLLKMHEQQLKKVSAETASLYMAKASDKRKQAYKQWLAASLLDARLTRNQLRSWLIQYAVNNGIIRQAGDVEKIKQFRSGRQDRLSDLWFKLLIDSGLYPDTEPLASPIALTQRLADIASQFIEKNTHYPFTAYDSPVLLFSRYEFLIGFMFDDESGYLPEPDNAYEILYRALYIAIFHDEVRISHDLTAKTLASSEGLLARSTPAGKSNLRASVKWFRDDAMTIPATQAVCVRHKKAGQAASSATWARGQKPFPKPENLLTAFAYIFNVMTYHQTNNKTRIYNMPRHRQRIMDAFQVFSQAVSSEPPLADNLHGYACFLIGWLHEQKLINYPSPEKAATWYEQAASRGKFIPLNLKAGDLFVKMGDYHNACRCYEQMQQQLQTLVDSPGEDPAMAEGGYLSPAFRTFLTSKIEYARIKAKDTCYLRGLTPAEIQRYINGDNRRETPTHQQTNSLTANRSRQPVCSQPPCQPESTGDGSFPNKGLDSATGNDTDNTLPTPATEHPGCSERTRQPVIEQNMPQPTPGIIANPVAKKQRRAELSCLVRNRLTSQWDGSVHSLLKRFFNRKEQLAHTPEEQIAWLTPKLDKIRKKHGSEVLM